MGPSDFTSARVLSVALALRFALVFYGVFHDYFFEVPFTDVDYVVFTDAARHVAAGWSPFARATYRYTPALAYLVLPNLWWPVFGKLLFSTVDVLVVAGAQFALLRSARPSTLVQTHWLYVLALWLANPLTAIVAARGSADTLVCGAVLATLVLLRRRQFALAGLVHGALAVHLKLYPLIYIPSVWIWTSGALEEAKSRRTPLDRLLALIFNRRGVVFVLTSLLSFEALVLAFERRFGDQCTEEWIRYHAGRRDTRHNFSPYFYPLYLAESDEHWSRFLGWTAFVPQLAHLVHYALTRSADLPHGWLLTTVSFVALNKVSTSQYFVWFLCLLPVVAPYLELSPRRAAALAGAWFGAQALWLLPAYLLEFKGYNTFIYIWLASLALLATHLWILRELTVSYKPKTPVWPRAATEEEAHEEERTRLEAAERIFSQGGKFSTKED